jgi:hyperosmotically inducible protein
MKQLTSTLVLILLLFSAAFAQKAEKAPAKEKAPAAEKAEKAKKAPAEAAPVDDASLTTAVKEKIGKTPSLKDSEVNVAVKDGVVTLTGKVKTAGAKGVATNVAKSVKGVKKVDNQLAAEAGIKKAPAKEKAAEKPKKIE